MPTLERAMEKLIFASRWILAPFFLGLLVAMVVLLFKFLKELLDLVLNIWTTSDYDVVISILTLVDTALIAVLLLIIVFSGYESFVSKINTSDHEDRPAWMGAAAIFRGEVPAAYSRNIGRITAASASTISSLPFTGAPRSSLPCRQGSAPALSRAYPEGSWSRTHCPDAQCA